MLLPASNCDVKVVAMLTDGFRGVLCFWKMIAVVSQLVEVAILRNVGSPQAISYAHI